MLVKVATESRIYNYQFDLITHAIFEVRIPGGQKGSAIVICGIRHLR